MSAKYKLYYFDVKGKAEVIRLVFSAAGQEYEDVRLSYDEWPKLKSEMPFLQVPALEVTENSRTYKIAQSTSIIKFLANRFGLAGNTEVERTHADMLTEEIIDNYNLLHKLYKKPNGEEKTKELANALTNTVPANLKLIQNILEANGNEYLTGKSLTYADLYLLYFYDWLIHKRDDILSQLPSLKSHYERIKNLPGIDEHLKKNANVIVHNHIRKTQINF